MYNFVKKSTYFINANSSGILLFDKVFKIKSAESKQVIESAEVRMFPYPHCIFVTILKLTQLNLRAALPEMVQIECDL